MTLNIPATLYVCVKLSPRRLILEYDTEMPSPKSTWRLVDSESPYRKKAKRQVYSMVLHVKALKLVLKLWSTDGRWSD